MAFIGRKSLVDNYSKKKPTKKYKNDDLLYWRYKKKTAPIDEFAHLNGEVKIVKKPKKVL